MKKKGMDHSVKQFGTLACSLLQHVTCTYNCFFHILCFRSFFASVVKIVGRCCTLHSAKTLLWISHSIPIASSSFSAMFLTCWQLQMRLSKSLLNSRSKNLLCNLNPFYSIKNNNLRMVFNASTIVIARVKIHHIGKLFPAFAHCFLHPHFLLNQTYKH